MHLGRIFFIYIIMSIFWNPDEPKKPWWAQEVLNASIALPANTRIMEKTIQLLTSKSDLSESLSTAWKEAKALWKEFPDVFTTWPWKTTLINFKIILKPKFPIQKGFSQLPKWLWEMVKKEVQNILCMSWLRNQSVNGSAWSCWFPKWERWSGFVLNSVSWMQS